MGKPITEIKKELEECALQELQSRMQQYEQDERKGVQNLLARRCWNMRENTIFAVISAELMKQGGGHLPVR